MRESTSLTPIKVAQKTTFLEWDSQPSLFKYYPHFCYRLSEHPALEWLFHLRKITSAVNVASKPYYRMNVPSAGNLHPIEVYVQIRNISGIIDGIYHLSPSNHQIALIQEIGRDGIEPYVGLENRFNGFIVMFSIVPFRSQWKYGLRAWRYCYLDLGHQISELCGVTDQYDMNPTKLSPIESNQLNRVMGMSDDEFIAAVYAFGETGHKKSELIGTELMSVQPCDYTYRNRLLIEILSKEKIYSSYKQNTHWNLEISEKRRSARDFYPPNMSDSAVKAVIDLPHGDELEVIHIVMQAQTMQHGVYRNGICTDEGEFSSEIVHLLLEQRFIAGASVVSLIFGIAFDAFTHIEAGQFAHELYLLSEQTGSGCSGIGAFYDDEASRWSDNPLLYAVAIGGKI